MSAVLELDHLIVGGGIQGVTLLDRLVAAGAGRVLLASRDALGVGETLHSHGYMHLGYTLPTADVGLGAELRDCAALWWERLERRASSYLEQPPTFFGVAEPAVGERLAVWDALGLRYDALDAPPEALRGGAAERGVRHFRIRDRTVPMRELVEDVAAPHADRIVRAELTRIELDAAGRRVVACRLAGGPRGNEELLVRPRTLLLAAGRDVQALLRDAVAPDGSRPLRDTHRELHRVRFVPMLIVRGRGLPPLTTVLQSHALSIATHRVDADESMWIVTSLRDHETGRGDFDAARESLPGPALGRSLEQLAELVPGVRDRLRDDLRLAFYHGGKIDHPEGGNARCITDAGIENLRVVWPGLWSLALANADDVARELAPCGSSDTPALDDLAWPRGAPVGEELRLTDALTWRAGAELA